MSFARISATIRGSGLLDSSRLSFASGSSGVRRLSSKASKGSKGKDSSTNKRPRIKTQSAGVEGVWYTPATAGSRKSLDMGRFGLKRLDYATLTPSAWSVPPHPPTKSVAERVIFPMTILITAGLVLWVYMNPEEEDMREYWKRVETGQILLDDDDDDDDWEDDDEED